jgi:hypothetical protein
LVPSNASKLLPRNTNMAYKIMHDVDDDDAGNTTVTEIAIAVEATLHFCTSSYPCRYPIKNAFGGVCGKILYIDIVFVTVNFPFCGKTHCALNCSTL